MLRIATPDDTAAIVNLIGLSYRESGFGRVNEQKALEAATHIISKQQCGVTLHKNEIVGSLGLVIGTLEFGDDTMLIAKWFCIHPDHCADKSENGVNAGHAAKLIEWARAASNRCRLPLFIETATAHETQTKLRWFRKRMTQFRGGFIHIPRAA